MRRGARACDGAMLLRVVAVVLVALFMAAVLHELLLVLLGHEHDHDHANCPFCLLIYTPLLLGLSAASLAWLFSGRAGPIPVCEVPISRRFALKSEPRAPPLS